MCLFLWRLSLGRSWHTQETRESFGTNRMKVHLGSEIHQSAISQPWTSLAIFSPSTFLLGSFCQRQPSGFSGWWYKHQARRWKLTIALLGNRRHFMPSLVSVSLSITWNGWIQYQMKCSFIEHWPCSDVHIIVIISLNWVLIIYQAHYTTVHSSI